MAKHQIIKEYDKLGTLFAENPMGDAVTEKLIKIYELCSVYLEPLHRVSLANGTGTDGKTYEVYQSSDKFSRPVNVILFSEGKNVSQDGKNKVSVFWENLKCNCINQQSADDITAAIYVIAISFCCCADLLGSGQKIAGTYFERLIGHLYTKHLNSTPVKQMAACELDDVSIKIPTDFIFNLGANKPKFHVPVKTSTRDRVVQVWAQQRVLDGAYGVGRFLCLLTCISETDFDKKKMTVNDICVPNQWINYQLFIAQIKRAYYLDIPNRYNELNEGFPKIHVKKFGEFFHETDILTE